MNDFKFSNEIGSLYQDILARELIKVGIFIQCHTSNLFQKCYGENPQGIECKHDSKISKTGNIYFETSAINRKHTEFIEGGIEKQDNAWLYVIGNGRECWIFAKCQLKALYRKVRNNPDIYREKGIFLSTHFDKDTNEATSNGMVVQVSVAENYALKHIVFEKDYTKWLENY